MLQKTILFIGIISCILIACQPDRDDDFQLPGTPGNPAFSATFVEGDSNRLVIKDLSEGNFQRFWDMPGGTPKSSTKAIDTVLFNKSGVYTITLYVSKTDGSGSPSASQTVTITKNAALTCTPKFSMLTGDCGPQGKCWTLSTAAGAVKVGPTYDDFSWYTSPVNGLQGAQYDDSFCFTFENLVFQYKNNGATVNPWNGYQAEAYNPGISDFTYLEGTGISGRDQILLQDNQFMGVWDCDNLLDVVKLTDTELIVRGRQREQNGTPKPEGWFELRFVPQ
jgi:hypothetical protein